MRVRSKYYAIAAAGVACLLMLGCGTGSGSVYVGVSSPGPWYGYPNPGRYPGGGVWVGVPVCCDDEDMDAMAEPLESTERHAEAADDGPDDSQSRRADTGAEDEDATGSLSGSAESGEERQDG
jgi:hypothetical protein